MLKTTRKTDPAVYDIVAAELKRQEGNIEMIASESTAPTEVLELSGSVFTNKTEEGYPGARFQAGSEEADKIENLARDRAKALFGADHVNVQSYSGSTANYCVYSAILAPGDRVLSMRLDQGGHLTHGSPVNFLRKVYEYDFYGVDPETEQIDYDALEKKAMEYKPKLIIGGASSYPRLIDYERMAEIAKKCGAYLMIDMAHIAGLVAAKVIPSPIPYADFVSSSTTKTFCGPRSGMVFCKAEHAKLLDKGTFPGTIGSIHLATIAAKAWSFGYASTPEFKAIMEQIVKNAKCLAEALQNYGFRIISGGTDNHIVMVDLRPKNLTGKAFEEALEYVGITVNKNVIPFDKESPMVTSGVRIGLTSTTQRGLKEKEITQIAGIMNEVAGNVDNKAKLDELKAQAAALISEFPLYPEGYFED
ncbi:serine hydroxymethyltransferase [Eubacterium limosum]|uniref:2-methylserine hydroxymethyltransferase n=1 Tax=Eubacterium limosum TaxID=1736 RepID=A0ABT5UVF0_EUBLI|nr:serine hydroxymethyltransferase [Eubacterium limosum]MCB6570281.1 serine hydroxymethyltransferase [Eubacterium limosum]MDE1471457.1 serine hydroxymethyltransferase [Eubacterium limosum]